MLNRYFQLHALHCTQIQYIRMTQCNSFSRKYDKLLHTMLAMKTNYRSSYPDKHGYDFLQVCKKLHSQ